MQKKVNGDNCANKAQPSNAKKKGSQGFRRERRKMRKAPSTGIPVKGCQEEPEKGTYLDYAFRKPIVRDLLFDFKSLLRARPKQIFLIK